ncbi:MAG: hypothetical protein JO168_20610 [Solirubrobacterales bacterium]|nr:hypothetical protein [Solirubrobacterales bacterium]MBV9716745.1 hypothetical protein [Solirubrobacterales bacterium]
MSRGAAIGAAVVLGLGLGLAGCKQPGTPASASEAAQLDVATSRLSVACGYADELTAFGGQHPDELAYVESIAVSGAEKLAAVFARNQTGIYQGESVGAIVNDSISLLEDCGLPRARAVLERAMANGG